MSSTLYREILCEHGWFDAHDWYTSKSLTHKDVFWPFFDGECPGGSREEVTIDYEAAARLGVVWADLTEKQKVARIAYVKPFIDAALKSAGFTMMFASEKGA